MPDKSWYPLLVMLAGLVIVLVSMMTAKVHPRLVQLAMIAFGVGLLVVLSTR